MKKISFIINPKSGKGYWNNIEEKITRYLNKSFLKTIHYIKREGHATELAHEAAKTADIIVSVGGDGTMNETARGIVGASACLGIIPLGSGNSLARHLGIPMDPKGAIGCLNKGNYQPIDTATLNDTPFFAISGTGFDAEIAAKFRSCKKRGFWTYVKLSLTHYIGYKPVLYTIFIDGKAYHQKAFLICVANSCQYGNNAHIAPNASLQDGLLELCIVKPFTFLKGIALTRRLFNKSIHRSGYVEIIQGRNIEISKADGTALCMHYDGEILPPGNNMNIKVRPKTLNVVFPEGMKI
jgi:YegS/Rv2252/BmrU family lipid kinase